MPWRPDRNVRRWPNWRPLRPKSPFRPAKLHVSGLTNGPARILGCLLCLRSIGIRTRWMVAIPELPAADLLFVGKHGAVLAGGRVAADDLRETDQRDALHVRPIAEQSHQRRDERSIGHLAHCHGS